MIEKYIRNIKTNPLKYVNYEKDGMSVPSAINHFKANITGKEGIVIGSIIPWVEALALGAGAAHVTTLEYQQIDMGHPNMTHLHPMKLANEFENYIEKYDFAITFSSIEHSGLGRYGDPIDPIGDIRETQKVWCELKTGGLFFLGVPVGRDTVAFNAHRVYGRIRLPLLFEGFELVATFENTKPSLVEVTKERLEMITYNHLFFVLRKL